MKIRKQSNERRRILFSSLLGLRFFTILFNVFPKENKFSTKLRVQKSNNIKINKIIKIYKERRNLKNGSKPDTVLKK